MSDNNSDSAAAPADPTIFSAVITPHRSLTPRGFLILMLCLGGRELRIRHDVRFDGRLAGVRLLRARRIAGLWAFRANFRAARAYEEVTVTASELTVRKVSHRGGVREWTLNPLWVRLERIVHEEFGIERLFLVSRGRRLPIAAFLGAQRRRACQGAVGCFGRSQARADQDGV